MTDLYKQIPFFSNYAISDNGIVYRISDGVFLEPFILNEYKNLTLIDDTNESYTVRVHRLVAMTYHGLPPGWERLVVNHINGNKLDCRAVNLEWCTQQENMFHAGLYGLTPKCIPIQVRNVITGNSLNPLSTGKSFQTLPLFFSFVKQRLIEAKYFKVCISKVAV